MDEWPWHVRDSGSGPVQLNVELLDPCDEQFAVDLGQLLLLLHLPDELEDPSRSGIGSLLVGLLEASDVADLLLGISQLL